MLDKKKYWLISLISIILLLGCTIFYEIRPFISGILGACTIYIIVRKQQTYLTLKRKIKAPIAAILIIIEVIVLFLIPFSIALWLLIDRISSINLNPSFIISHVQELNNILHEKLNYNLLSTQNLLNLTSKVTYIIELIVSQVSSFFINAIVLIFVLYFMLLGGNKMETYIYSLLPFNDSNKRIVVKSARLMVRSNALGIPLLAVIQGLIATLGYIIFDIPDPILFGFLTCFSTIIPLIGTSIIWLPLVIYLFITGDLFNAIGLCLYSVIIVTNVDNVIRLFLQKKMANTHPMITVFGVIIGLSLFGFWGVIFGPLLLSIFMLSLHLFRKNYIQEKKHL